MKFQEFHDFMKKCGILGILRFRADLAPRMPAFYLQNKAILRAGRCRCRFHGILWKFMKFHDFEEKMKIMILQNFYKIHKNAPGPQNHY